MSITPVDKPPDGDGSGDTTQGRSSLLGEYIKRFVSWLDDRLGEPDDSLQHQSQSRDRNDTTLQGSAELKQVEAVNSKRFENLPRREKPLTYPARDTPGINSPDVVGVETEQGLRLSVPENPDAELVSDVWMDVQP